MVPKKTWQFVNPGDYIDIIAPSSTVITENLSEYYQNTTKLFAEVDLRVRIPQNLIQLGKDSFSANDLEYRANHLINLLQDPSCKVIWAIRGGYGAAKIIPFLEKIKSPVTPKLLLGFSDITALHLFVQNKWHWSSIHSVVINQLIAKPELINEMLPILLGDQKEIIYNQLVPLNDFARKEFSIEAEVTGGNLSIVQTSLATSWQVNAANKIIFLEDVGERGYRIDRILNHLLQAGVFNQAKAIIFGEITPGYESDGNNLCAKAIEDFVSNIHIPVLSLEIIGHNNYNSPLPLGASCKLVLGEEPKLICSTGGAAC